MTSKLANEIYKLAVWQESLRGSAIISVENSLDEVRTVLESFRVRVTECWCFSPEFHTDRCKAAQELFDKLRKE